MSQQPIEHLDHDEPHYRDIPLLAFNPPEHITTKILSDICGSSLMLGDIALKARTTVEALSLWLTRPEIDARLNAMESLFARRCRIQLANNTGAIMRACNAVIDNYIGSESHLLFRENDLRGHTVMARKASNALLATRILLHLARHFSSTPGAAPRPHRTPAPIQPPAPAPSGPTPNPAPTHTLPNSAPNTTRFTLLPPLSPLMPLTTNGGIPGAATPNPTRDNAHTPPTPSHTSPEQSDGPNHPTRTFTQTPSHTSPEQSDGSNTPTRTFPEPLHSVRGSSTTPNEPLNTPVPRAGTEGSSAPVAADPIAPAPNRPDPLCACDRTKPCQSCTHPSPPQTHSRFPNPDSPFPPRTRDPTPA